MYKLIIELSKQTQNRLLKDDTWWKGNYVIKMNELIRKLFSEEYFYQGSIHEELGARLKMPYIIVFPVIIVVCILLLIVNIKNNKNKKSKIACSILLLLFILLIIYVMCIAYTTEWKAISLDI